MKTILLIITVTMTCVGIRAQNKVIFQTDSYHGFKRFDEFSIKDSLLFYFSNGNMSGCTINILRYDHTRKGIAYYKIDERNYSLLSGALKKEEAATDSVLFSAVSFCPHEGPSSYTLKINGTSYELDENGNIRISRKELFPNSNAGIVRIEFTAMGVFKDNVFLNEDDNLVLYFFHLNTNNTVMDVQKTDIIAIHPGKNDNEKYCYIGKIKKLFKKINYSESGFSPLLLKFLNIGNGTNS